MNRTIRALASLKLTVILVLVIAVILSIGTILESLRGAEAGRAVYYSPFFLAIQGLFALNLIAALWERWPKNRYRIGFVVTHASMLLILAGALATVAFKVEGRLPLWEGQSADWIFRGGPGEEPVEFKLPFALRLDSFEIDNYPGTRRPAMFRSRVTVLPKSGEPQPAVIEMNRPLSYGGFTFFQSSYQIQGGREMSILSVSRDPGQAIVFVGYGLLVLGMIIVLATRIAQYREAERSRAEFERQLAGSGAGAAAKLVAVALLALSGAAQAAQVPSPEITQKVRRLPVQSDGRTMPFDTQARDSVRTVTGRRSWPGIEPAAMALGWTIDPQGWIDAPIIRIDDAHIAGLLGLPAGTRYASYRALVGSQKFRQAVAEAHQRQSSESKPDAADKHLLKEEERIGELDSYLRGQAIRPLPAADPVAAWQPPANLTSAAGYADLEVLIRPSAPAHYPSVAAIELELRYNALRPTRIAWILLLPAAIAAGLSLDRDRRRWLAPVAAIGAFVGFLVMSWGIATRWQIAGHIPASNMYESMLFLGWGVGLFAVVSLLLRNRMLVFNATAMSALVMMLLDLLPMDPFIHPIPPVLSGTPWLAIHVPIIMVSYSVFAISTFLAHVVIGIGIFRPGRKEAAARWSELLYWYLMVGSILLIAGILTGSIWAASSWGRYWGWDPKEVWSLVAFLAYMAILHARFDGQIKPFGVAVSTIAAFWTILMTYLGVNFVLASGLHSYGFGSSNLVRTMGIVAAVEIGYVLAGWWAHKKREAPAPAAS